MKYIVEIYTFSRRARRNGVVVVSMLCDVHVGSIPAAIDVCQAETSEGCPTHHAGSY